MTEWLPIETAPTGKTFEAQLRANGKEYPLCIYSAKTGKWRGRQSGNVIANPTHWKPVSQPREGNKMSQYNVPESWEPVHGGGIHYHSDFPGQKSGFIPAIIGWKTPDGFVSPDKLPEEYRKRQEPTNNMSDAVTTLQEHKTLLPEWTEGVKRTLRRQGPACNDFYEGHIRDLKTHTERLLESLETELRRAAMMEECIIKLHLAEVLSEGQVTKVTGLDIIEVRTKADELAERMVSRD